MATSRNTGYRSQTRFWERVFDRLSRYDLLLVAIPLAFVFAVGLYLLTGVQYHAAVSVGALGSVVVLVDALYLNPPSDEGMAVESVPEQSP